MNSVQLIGRLIDDPKVTKTQSGKSKLSAAISVNRPGAKKDESTGYYPSDLIRIERWEGTADFIERYFSKGDTIALTGQIRVDTGEDKNGNKTTWTKVLVGQIFFTGSKPQPQQTTTVSKEVLDRRREAKRQRMETFSAPTGTVNRVSMNDLDGFQTVDDMSGDLPFNSGF